MIKNHQVLKQAMEKVFVKYKDLFDKLAYEENSENYFSFVEEIIGLLQENYHYSYKEAIRLFDDSDLAQEIGYHLVQSVEVGPEPFAFFLYATAKFSPQSPDEVAKRQKLREDLQAYREMKKRVDLKKRNK